MSTTTTPYMNLTLPTPTVTVGPNYGIQEVAAFTAIDSHNHTVNQGVQVPTAGLNINADLSFNGFNATALRAARLQPQLSTLGLASDIGCLYVVSGNLYYNNGTGVAIQLTSGSSLNASSIGAISGLGGTSAALTYSSGTTAFTFTSAATQAAPIVAGPVTVSGTTANAKGVTFQTPSGLAASYGLTLLPTLPASTKILTCDSSGNLASVYDVDNSTLQVTSNTLLVKASGITSTQIASGAVGTTQLQAGSVTPATRSAAVYGVTATCGSYARSSTTFQVIGVGTGAAMNVTLTTTGRPVMIKIIQDPAASSAYLASSGSAGGGQIRFLIDGTAVGFTLISYNVAYPVLEATATPSAGAHTFTAEARSNAVSDTVNVNNCALLVYEL